MNVCPTIDQVAEWSGAVGMEIFALYLLARGAYILKVLHDNRTTWNCGNLTFREARIWVEAIIVLSIMLLFAQLEMIGWVYTGHICDHTRFFWACTALHVGNIMVAKRILRFVYKSAHGMCIHSHGTEEE